MSDNKFIQRLKGQNTSKSVLEISNEATKTSFANMPQGTSNALNVYSDHRGNATAVLEGTDIWKLNNSQFVVVPNAFGDGRDFTSTYTVAGSSLWVNATHTFDQPKIFTGATRWTLKLCGHSLLSSLSNIIGFSLIIKFGNAVTITKSFSVIESAFEFCKEFIIDFSESEQSAIKVANGDTMTVQLLCADATASATIYNGMTTLVAQQRRVDGEAVASDLHTFEDLEVEIAEIQDNITDINGKIIVRSATIPTPSADLVGKAYQYSGITNGVYTHNYIYECQEIETNSMVFTPNTVYCDWADLSVFLQSNTADYDSVTNGTMIYIENAELWRATFADANGDTVLTYQQYTGDWERVGFEFTGTFQDGDIVSFTRTKTVFYDWIRADVQPNHEAQILALQADVSDIQALIPAQASPTNQLGDKAFINSSIATNTANFIGTFNSVAELEAYSGTVTNNDYAFVIGTDSAGNTTYNRYKYTTATTPASWIYEYTLNNSSFTADQWAAINSGVTASDVSKARSAVQPSDLGNGTITITQGGETKGTFTTNQGNNTTIDLDSGGGYHPDLFDYKWTDHICNDVQWLRADTFSWQSGSVYQAAYKHLRNDMYNWYSWENNGTTIYTKKAYPEVGEKAYSNSALTTEVGEITAVTDTLDITVEKITVNGVVYDSVSGSNISPTTETVGGVTVQYIPAEDGHKIVTDFHISEVEAVYAATGVAWYYIIDYGFKRFKLPRMKPLNGAIAGNGIALGLTDGTNNYGMSTNSGGALIPAQSNYGQSVGDTVGTGYINNTTIGLTTDPTKSGIIAERDNTDQYKYLYFYVGSFTQTALENTAGLNAELFNGKVDVGHEVIAFQAPTAENNYTWYRLYADGWVEQGGQFAQSGDAVSITLPVTMANTNYSIVGGTLDRSGAQGWRYANRTTTGFTKNLVGSTDCGGSWEVRGIAAN